MQNVFYFQESEKRIVKAQIDASRLAQRLL